MLLHVGLPEQQVVPRNRHSPDRTSITSITKVRCATTNRNFNPLLIVFFPMEFDS